MARSGPCCGGLAVPLAVVVTMLAGLLSSCGSDPAGSGGSSGSGGSAGSARPPAAASTDAPGLGYVLEGYGLENLHTGDGPGSTDVSDLPPGRPGELVSAVRVPAPAGLGAWRMLYHSRDLSGADRLVTGLVLVPPADLPVPAGGRRVVSFGHGTTGINDACAPSRADPPVSTVAGTVPLVLAGNVLAITDYTGLGGPGEHPIYVAEVAGRAMLDAARAARSLTETRAGDDVVLWGYSQGGQAALAGGALAESYAPELRVRGVAATAPLADVPTSLRQFTQAPDGVAYVLYAAIGLTATDPSIDLDTILTPTGRRLTAIARNHCAVALLQASSGESLGTVFTRDPLTTEPFAAGFARQWHQIRLRMAPTLVLQGDLDTVIHQPTTEAVVRGLCATGTRVEYRRYGLADHGTVLTTSMADLSSWIDARFTDTAPPPAGYCRPL